MPFRKPAKSDGLQEWMARECQRNLCCWHALVMILSIKKIFFLYMSGSYILYRNHDTKMTSNIF